MAHWSEDAVRLECQTSAITQIADLPGCFGDAAAAYFYRFPWGRTQADAEQSEEAFREFAGALDSLPPEATVCILTTPPDAAALLPFLQNELKFQLWVAVKTTAEAYPAEPGQLPRRHAALLVLTRDQGTLRHTKTRIGYSYCPACGKTTKDYGGKKHTYHEYGTLASDVWRDMEIDPRGEIAPLTERLCDLFGLAPYRQLHVLDMRECTELRPQAPGLPPGTSLPLAGEQPAAPESQLIHGDCLEALRTMPENCVDFCFADPPYNLKKAYDKWNDALEIAAYFTWCDEWLSELGRVLKPGRTLAVLNIPQWTARHYQHVSGFMRFQNWIAWDGLSFPVRRIMPAHYGVLCLSKGEPRPLPGLQEQAGAEHALRPLMDGFCLRAACVQARRHGENDRGEVSDLWTDVHRLKHNSRRVDHPCQLPPLLMQRLYALFTRPGETVLDCFNGAGTSTLVAKQMGRGYVGMELSAQYHQLALARHAELARGGNPFGKTQDEDTPKAKNSRVGRRAKQRYEVSKKELQLDVRRIARELGRLPSRSEVETLSPYPIRYFDDYFSSWGEVCAAARSTGMSEMPNPPAHEPGPLQMSLL